MEEEEVEEVEGTTRGVWTIQRKSRALSSSCHPLWLPLLYLLRLLRLLYWDALKKKKICEFSKLRGGDLAPNLIPVEMAKRWKNSDQICKGDGRITWLGKIDNRDFLRGWLWRLMPHRHRIWSFPIKFSWIWQWRWFWLCHMKQFVGNKELKATWSFSDKRSHRGPKWLLVM